MTKAESTQFSVRVPKMMKRRLDAWAKQHDMTPAEAVRHFLQRHLGVSGELPPHGLATLSRRQLQENQRKSVKSRRQNQKGT